ncbi:hypothetical protein KAJ87_04175 [Candidatus Pacearchaeota archaeon]|nr:hypothetical protein [Candidatus Pacearchaeota archaeon]
MEYKTDELRKMIDINKSKDELGEFKLDLSGDQVLYLRKKILEKNICLSVHYKRSAEYFSIMFDDGSKQDSVKLGEICKDRNIGNLYHLKMDKRIPTRSEGTKIMVSKIEEIAKELKKKELKIL